MDGRWQIEDGKWQMAKVQSHSNAEECGSAFVRLPSSLSYDATGGRDRVRDGGLQSRRITPDQSGSHQLTGWCRAEYTDASGRDLNRFKPKIILGGVMGPMSKAHPPTSNYGATRGPRSFECGTRPPSLCFGATGCAGESGWVKPR